MQPTLDDHSHLCHCIFVRHQHQLAVCAPPPGVVDIGAVLPRVVVVDQLCYGSAVPMRSIVSSSASCFRPSVGTSSCWARKDRAARRLRQGWGVAVLSNYCG